MQLEDAKWMQDLTDQERMVFLSGMNVQRKNTTTGVLMALILGNVGGHHFYMRHFVAGVAYLLLCWTFLPGIVALIEAFLMPGRVREYNDRVALELTTNIKALRSGPSTATPIPELPQAGTVDRKKAALAAGAAGLGGAVAGAAASSLATDTDAAAVAGGEVADAASGASDTVSSILENL